MENEVRSFFSFAGLWRGIRGTDPIVLKYEFRNTLT